MTKFEDVSRSLHACLTFLARCAYIPLPDDIRHSPLLGDQLLIRYESSASGRDVRIHFSPATASHADRFSVFIGSIDGQSLFVNDYLTQCGQHDLSQPFINSAPEKTTTAFRRDVASILRLEFETWLADLIQGRPWNSPTFDWQPYK